MSTRLERLRAGFPRTVVMVLVVAALINLAPLPWLSVRERPLWKHGDGDLAHLVLTDDQTTAWRFGIYVELGRIASGGTIVVPLESWFDPYVARNLAGVQVEKRRMDAAIWSAPPGLAPMGLLQVDGEMMSYWIVPGPPTDLYWLGEVDGGWAVVPSSLEEVPEVDRG